MIFDKIIDWIKRLLKGNKIKALAEANAIPEDGNDTNIINVDDNSTVKLDKNENVDHGFRDLVVFDEELLLLAKEFENAKKSYIIQKQELDYLDSKLKRLEQSNNN